MARFYQSLTQFNTIDPIGSIYEQSFSKGGNNSVKPLVEIICYALNLNHYHLLLKQVSERGIEKFIHRLGTGYTKYFNHKHKRTGVLFQGKFKSIHIKTNEYLIHLSVYINLNDRVHKLGSPTSKLQSRTSLKEYSEYCSKSRSGSVICYPSIILDQFATPAEFLSLAEDTLPQILATKDDLKEMNDLLLE